MIRANDPNRKTWMQIPEGSDFTMQNLPFGVFKTDLFKPRVGVAIGDQIIDLYSLSILGYLQNMPFQLDAYLSPSLNNLMSYGKDAVRDLRNRISDVLEENNEELRDHDVHLNQVLFGQEDVQMLMPLEIGDYTDFYSSVEHATNVGTMFRDPANALLPNWKHLPVGYHGRSSSIIVSGQDIKRPMGQSMPAGAETPVFGPSKRLDFELEMAFITYDGKPLGDRISTDEAEDYIFGMVLFNDWSARDMQAWEYVPLGPFLAKNFASTISPWIVTLDALEPSKTSGPVQEPKVLPYLQYKEDSNYDINLEVGITPEVSGKETVVCKSNTKHLYWNIKQQLAHHTVNGCNVRRGDMMASGTISGPTEDSYGSMLELAWKGTKPLTLDDGQERKFIEDGDVVSMRAAAYNNGIKIGFGEVKTKVLPAE